MGAQADSTDTNDLPVSDKTVSEKTPSDKPEPAEASARRLLGIVRDVLGVANSGGGEVEINTPGAPIDVEVLRSRIAELTDGEVVEVELTAINAEHQTVVLTVGGHPSPPLVVARDAEAGAGRSGIALRKGDVFVRHGSQVRRAKRGDFVGWIGAAVDDEARRWKSRIGMLAEIPAGSQIRVLPSSGEAFDEPTVLLERALTLWRANPSRLLSGNELVVLFLARESLPQTDEVTELLVASALRRRPTLWFWLAERRPSTEALLDIFDSLIDGGDRDKTDAARSLVEVAALFEPAQAFADRLAQLQRSRYRHFQQAAENTNRIEVLDRLAANREASIRRRPVSGFGTVELVQLADQLAAELRNKPSSSRSRQLTTVGLELFARDLEAAARQMSEG